MIKFNIGYGAGTKYHLFKDTSSKITLCKLTHPTNYRHAYIQWENVNWVEKLPGIGGARNPVADIEKHCCIDCLKVANEKIK
jgi:hypothetical protein